MSACGRERRDRGTLLEDDTMTLKEMMDSLRRYVEGDELSPAARVEVALCRDGDPAEPVPALAVGISPCGGVAYVLAEVAPEYRDFRAVHGATAQVLRRYFALAGLRCCDCGDWHADPAEVGVRDEGDWQRQVDDCVNWVMSAPGVVLDVLQGLQGEFPEECEAVRNLIRLASN